MVDIPRRFAAFLTVLLLAVSVACASTGPRVGTFDERSGVELYRRPAPAKLRIPGAVASGPRYASAEPPMHKHTRRDPALLERERGQRFAGGCSRSLRASASRSS